jgi:hypothetical protein
MRHRMISLVAFLSLALPTSATAQTVQELRIRWDAYVGAPAPQVSPGTYPASSLYTILERRRAPGSLPRERNPEPSPGQIVVVAVDSVGEVIDAQVVRDPRVLRFETQGPGGKMTGELLHRSNPEFLLTVPDDPRLHEIRLYVPRWTGTYFVADHLGTIPLY